MWLLPVKIATKLNLESWKANNFASCSTVAKFTWMSVKQILSRNWWEIILRNKVMIAWQQSCWTSGFVHCMLMHKQHASYRSIQWYRSQLIMLKSLTIMHVQKSRLLCSKINVIYTLKELTVLLEYITF